MSESRTSTPSQPSKNVVVAAVAVLIIVAIAGIVLAGRQAPESPAAASSGTTPDGASSPTAAPPSEIVFTPGADKMPATASDAIARFADAARANTGQIRLVARYLTGENKARELELAKARTAAIRHALEADGISSGRIQVDLVEVGAGALTGTAAQRVDLSLR